MEKVMGFPSTSMNDCQLNVTKLMEHAVRNYARQEVVSKRHDGQIHRYTYHDAYERMLRLAQGMTAQLGLQVGDRVGVLAWNTHENYEIYFGIPGTGAVMLLLNLRLSPVDLAYVIGHAGARFVMVDYTLLPLAEAVKEQCPSVEGWIIIGDKPLADIDSTLSPVYSYEEILAAARPEFAWPNLDERSAYAACYTTGTTGRPKGVFYSHRNMCLHTMTIATGLGAGMDDCVYQLVPMFHALGWGMPQMATAVGAKFVLPGMYNLERLGDLAEFLVSEQVTVTAGAPALFMPMLEYIRSLDKKPDLTGAKFLCGATEPPLAMMKEYHELTGAEIMHAYGATETSPLVSANRLKPWLDAELTEEEKWDLKRKQGLCAVGLDIKLLDPVTGQDLPFDGQSVGEVCIRGPWITGRYHNNPDGDTQFTEDGFWKSGDAGTIDQEGYLKITDRIKDIIKSGGEWISTVDLENEIVAHPGVLMAAVVGLRHPKWEERPLALVVPRPEMRDKLTKEDIDQHLLKKFAKWQLPDKVIFVDSIPQTSVGKIDKKVIREQYKEAYLS